MSDPRQAPKQVNPWLVLLFQMFSLGLYTPYWFSSRSGFLNQLEGPKKIPAWAMAWLWVEMVVTLVGRVVPPDSIGGQIAAILGGAVLVLVIGGLFAWGFTSLRTCTILTAEYARQGRPRKVYKGNAFVLGPCYLQYHINKLFHDGTVNVTAAPQVEAA